MDKSDIVEFKKNIQYAFQKGFEDVFGKCEETILPEKESVSQFGMLSKSYIQIQRCGKLALHTLKNAIFTFM